MAEMAEREQDDALRQLIDSETTTDDERFHLELMERLGEEYPNAFERRQTLSGEPVWTIRSPLVFDPTNLQMGATWHITKDGIIGTNEMVNPVQYEPDKLLDAFREAKEKGYERFEGSDSLYQVGEREGFPPDYAPFMAFDVRRAAPDTQEEFGLYLRIAELTGERLNSHPPESKTAGMEEVMGNIRRGSGN